MVTDSGRSPSGRATLASHQAPAGLGHSEGIPNAGELSPCLACGAECRVETFGETAVLAGPIDLWVCSQHKMFGGHCPEEASYFGADAWNTAMRIVQEVGRESAIEEIGNNVAYWLRWTRDCHQREGIPVTRDTHIMPPSWPSYGQLCHWLDRLNPAQAIEARRAIDSEAGVVHESAVGNADAPE